MSALTEDLYRSLHALPRSDVSALGACVVHEVWSRVANGAGRELTVRAAGSVGHLVATDLVAGAFAVETAAFNNTLRFAEQQAGSQASRNAAAQSCCAAPVFAATALAEARKADFAVLYYAAGIGIEAYSRLAASLAAGAQRKAFDARVIAATLASIVACAAIEKLSPESAAQALGLGSSAVTAMAQGRLPLQVAAAARDGIVMALLMQCGFRGPPDPLACRWGVYETFGDARDMAMLDVGTATVRAAEEIRKTFGTTQPVSHTHIALTSQVSVTQLVASQDGSRS